MAPFRPRNRDGRAGGGRESLEQAKSFPADDPTTSQQALREGNPVPAAMRRLGALAQRNTFTSDLSVNEFSLLRSAGYHPLTQVSGTCVYKIGYQPVPYGGSQPLSVISQAFNESRSIALSRLQKEASLAGADMVAGTRITQGVFDAESGLIEFSLIGTAVRAISGETDHVNQGRAALTTLSGQDLYLLQQNGFTPLGLVGSSSCYLASLSPYTFQQMYSMLGGAMVNFEVREFTEGYYASRRIVMHDIERDALRLGASGIIDFTFDSSTTSYQVPGSNQEAVGAVSFVTHVLATAIGQKGTGQTPEHPKIGMYVTN